VIAKLYGIKKQGTSTERKKALKCLPRIFAEKVLSENSFHADLSFEVGCRT